MRRGRACTGFLGTATVNNDGAQSIVPMKEMTKLRIRSAFFVSALDVFNTDLANDHDIRNGHVIALNFGIPLTCS